MQCPHCRIHFHPDWRQNNITRGNAVFYHVRGAHCPGCGKDTLEFRQANDLWVRFWPRGSSRPPAPAEVPGDIAKDYTEACEVLPISPKSSAALARRCLQAMLRAHGYTAPSLAQEIDLILNEQDTTRAIPTTLRQSIDGIRHFGNFSAHPITELTTLQVIDVEPGEAEQCLETVEEMFEHFYVRPALAAKRLADLNAKLQAAGKPPAKT